MKRRQSRTTWPLLFVVAGLFVLSATAPSLWEQKARDRAERRAAMRDEARRTGQVELASAAPTQRATAETAEAGPVEDHEQKPEAIVRQEDPEHRLEAHATHRLEAGAADRRYHVLSPSERIASRADEPTGKDSPAEPPVKDLAEPVSIRVANRPSIREAAPPEEVDSVPLPVLSHTPLPQHAGEPAPPAPIPVEEPTQPGGNNLWPEPTALLEQLDELMSECETGCWAMDVDRALRKLGAAMDRGTEDADRRIAEIVRLRREGEALAAQLGRNPLTPKVHRVGFALDRRIALWRGILSAGGLAAVEAGPDAGDAQALALCLNEVDAFTRETPQGLAWQKYLTLDALRSSAAGREREDQERRHALSRSVLDRLSRTRLDANQRQFLHQDAMVALRQELRRWAIEPVELASLVRHVEQYEETGLPSEAHWVAERCQRLAVSSVPARRQLAQELEAYYRNANVRIAVSDEFLNRFIPERAPEQGDVDDVVQGRRVRGRSLTSTEVKVRLIPDPQKLRLALQIDGLVSSLTHTRAGPARFLNDSRSTYSAWKEVEVGPDGLELHPAEVRVASDLRLRQLSTDFDGVPLLGRIVNRVARSEHESQRPEASAEIEAKVHDRAKQQVDAEADARLGGMAKRLEEQLVRPLADLSLGPTVIAAETTDRRVVLRVRLAADDQLGGHTPRPMAPDDSLASVQVHETALTNLLQRMRLDGARFTLPELRRYIAERFNRPEWVQVADTEHDDIAITFAPQNAAWVSCRDGCVTISLAVARLTKGDMVFDDFEVRAIYRPETNGRSPQLVREDVIQLIGHRLNTRSQIALRGIFSKAFAKQRPWKLLPDHMAGDPQMANLAVTQLTIDDGWLGVALGCRPKPQPTAAVRRWRR